MDGRVIVDLPVFLEECLLGLWCNDLAVSANRDRGLLLEWGEPHTAYMSSGISASFAGEPIHTSPSHFRLLRASGWGVVRVA